MVLLRACAPTTVRPVDAATPRNKGLELEAQTEAERGKTLSTASEFTVPLCRTHHRELHRSGSEYLWWENVGIDPLKIARKLWRRKRLQRGIASRRRRDDASTPTGPAVAPVGPLDPGASLQAPKTDGP
jgi:hypothetical protein